MAPHQSLHKAHVSTSLDSKAIRNPVGTSATLVRTARFQLPRIAKPSGTHARGSQGGRAQPVSTTPHSKAIRNVIMPGRSFPAVDRMFQLPRIAKPSGTRHPLPRMGPRSRVSTSPDSKAIRNASTETVSTRSSSEFQLPRIAKQSGTSRLLPSSSSRSTLFQLPRIAKPSGTPAGCAPVLPARWSFNFPG